MKMEKEIIITNDLSEIINITRFVESLGMSLLLPSHITRRISLALEEAVACMIRHSYPNGEKDSIKLKVSVINGDFTCMIINNGISFDPTLSLQKPDSVDSNAASIPKEELLTGGLEFYIVYRSMDEVAYHTSGDQNYLMLTKKINLSEEPESSLDINICKVVDAFIITLEGRLDTVNARKFESEITQLRKSRAVKFFVNCEKLTYISSSGLRSFILLQKSVSAEHGHLVLINMLPEIRKIFDMTGCTSIFTIH